MIYVENVLKVDTHRSISWWSNKEGSLTNMKKRFASVEHTGIPCDGCSIDSVVGIRFKCDTCLASVRNFDVYTIKKSKDINIIFSIVYQS
jgi:hypothetical protein